MALFGSSKSQMIAADRALPGRPTPLPGVPETHYVNGNRIQPPPMPQSRWAPSPRYCWW